MMRHLVIAGAIAALAAVSAGPVQGQTAPTAGSSLGNVTLPRPVLANGQSLPAGTYQVRLSGDVPTPAVGQSPEGSRYVEFVRGGQVVGREVATVISAAEVEQIAKGRRVPLGTARVDLLRGAVYLRVWINSGGTHFIIHMPPA
jgi:hypothetical protein